MKLSEYLLTVSQLSDRFVRVKPFSVPSQPRPDMINPKSLSHNCPPANQHEALRACLLFLRLLSLFHILIRATVNPVMKCTVNRIGATLTAWDKNISLARTEFTFYPTELQVSPQDHDGDVQRYSRLVLPENVSNNLKCSSLGATALPV